MTDPMNPVDPEPTEPAAPTPTPAPEPTPAPPPPPAPAPPQPEAAAAAPEAEPMSIPAGEITAFDAEVDAALAVATRTANLALSVQIKALGAAINDDADGYEYGDQDIRGALTKLVDLARDLGAAGRISTA